jgi:hypothetical protein
VNGGRGWLRSSATPGTQTAPERSPSWFVLAVACLVVAAIIPAAAQRRPNFGAGVDVRLEGVVEPVAGFEALGVLRIRAGDRVRRFAVQSARSTQGEGMSLFKRFALQAENLKLLGAAPLLERFGEAPAGTRLRLVGRLQSDRFVLAEVARIEAPAPAPGNPGR